MKTQSFIPGNLVRSMVALACAGILLVPLPGLAQSAKANSKKALSDEEQATCKEAIGASLPKGLDLLIVNFTVKFDKGIRMVQYNGMVQAEDDLYIEHCYAGEKVLPKAKEFHSDEIIGLPELRKYLKPGLKQGETAPIKGQFPLIEGKPPIVPKAEMLKLGALRPEGSPSLPIENTPEFASLKNQIDKTIQDAADSSAKTSPPKKGLFETITDGLGITKTALDTAAAATGDPRLKQAAEAAGSAQAALTKTNGVSQPTPTTEPENKDTTTEPEEDTTTEPEKDTPTPPPAVKHPPSTPRVVVVTPPAPVITPEPASEEPSPEPVPPPGVETGKLYSGEAVPSRASSKFANQSISLEFSAFDLNQHADTVACDLSDPTRPELVRHFSGHVTKKGPGFVNIDLKSTGKGVQAPNAPRYYTSGTVYVSITVYEKSIKVTKLPDYTASFSK